MAFLDTVLRRVSTQPARAVKPDASRSAEQTRSGWSFYYWCFFIHKWSGLFGACWLLVLGFTGFFLDHNSWRWQYQSKAPKWLTTEALVQNASRNVVSLLQIDPSDRLHQVVGGTRGIWFTSDGGETWSATAFPRKDHPQALAIEPDPIVGWDRLWFATDDGLYVSRDDGATASPLTLQGKYVTALTQGVTPGEMIAVVDKSEVFSFNTNEPAKLNRIEFAPLEPLARPEDVQVNRFVRELHFGRGIYDELTSLVVNDIGGIGMFVLSITGLLYWGLPKYWKYRAQRQAKNQPKLGVEAKTAKTSKSAKKLTIKWLFRIHSATLGITSVLMLIYLSITGILIGHNKELGEWMKTTRIPQAYLTPAFGIPSWSGWIDGIVAYPGQPGAFTVGNRIGLFTTVDGGKTWAREEGADGKPFGSATRLRRLGDRVMIMNGMGASAPTVVRGDDFINHPVAAPPAGAPKMERMAGMGAPAGEAVSGGRGGRGGGMFMPTDVTPIGNKIGWKSSDKLVITDDKGAELERIDVKQPADPGVPWFSWFLRVHMGTIFWSEWRWVNDVFATAAVFLSVTGLFRWWRQKWI